MSEGKHIVQPYEAIGCSPCGKKILKGHSYYIIDKSYFCSSCFIDQSVEVLSELASLVEDIISGHYKPDSFTLQPAKTILKAAGEEI